MNVLIFVMTMLMLLSLLTYARLETYRNSQITQIFFNHYMENEERSYINLAAEKLYIKTKGSAKLASPPKQADATKPKDEKKTPTPAVAATPRISLSLLVDKTQRESKPEEWKQTQVLLKNLIQTLYGDKDFYTKALDKQPNLLDELINNLTNTIDARPEENKLKTAAELGTLELPNKEIDTLFYKMLHGAPYQETVLGATQKPDLTPPDEQSEEQQDEEDQEDASLEKEADEYQSTKGYYSLLDFVNLSTTPKVRVFLAKREVLMAVFHDPTTVNDIIAQRQQYYSQALEGQPVKELSETFKNQYMQRRDPALDTSALDFNITKVNPNNYKKS